MTIHCPALLSNAAPTRSILTRAKAWVLQPDWLFARCLLGALLPLALVTEALSAPAVIIPVSELGRSRQGFSVSNNEPSGLSFAYEVCGLGDVNGDGLDDWILTSPNLPDSPISGGSPSSEEAWVIFGRAQQTNLNLANPGSAGFKITFGTVGRNRLSKAAAAGDLNGDGLQDIMLAARGANKAYIIYGRQGNDSILLDKLDTTQGFSITGMANPSADARFSIDGIGDFNADGCSDIAIGQDWIHEQDGRVFLILGQTSPRTNLDLAGLSGSGAILVIRPEVAGGKLGSVSGAGDVNGDGFDDLVIGAPLAKGADGEACGRAFVVFGRAEGLGRPIALNQASTRWGGFVISGASPGEQLGREICPIGDSNGDGLFDLAFGLPERSAPNSPGRVLVVFGKADSNEVSVTALNTGGYFINGEASGDRCGSSLGSAGDFNADGLADLLIGAPGVDSASGLDCGRVYLVFGNSRGTGLSLSNQALGQGFAISANLATGALGSSVAPAGDLNGDGLPDLLLANRPASSPASGTAFVVLGDPQIPGNNMTGLIRGSAVTGPASSSSHILLGSSGADLLTQGSGAGVGRMLSGAGSDRIVLNDTRPFEDLSAAGSGEPRARIDAGNGIDTLLLSNPPGAVDLTALTRGLSRCPNIPKRLQSIECIDLGDNRPQILTLNARVVAAVGSVNAFNSQASRAFPLSGDAAELLDSPVKRTQLLVSGRSGSDQLQLSDLHEWTRLTQNESPLMVTWQDQSYEIWNHKTQTLQLLVQGGLITQRLWTSSPSQLPGGTALLPYRHTFQSGGGQPPLSFSISSPNGPPAGLQLDPNTGTLSGVLQASGEHQFTLRISDSSAVPLQIDKRFTLQAETASLLLQSRSPDFSSNLPMEGTLTFEASAPGDSSSVTLRMRNPRPTALTLRSLQLSGPFAEDFRISSPPSDLNLNGDGYRDFTLTFNPTRRPQNLRHCTLSLWGTDPLTPIHSLRLSGLCRNIPADAQSISFINPGPLYVGQSRVELIVYSSSHLPVSLTLKSEADRELADLTAHSEGRYLLNAKKEGSVNLVATQAGDRRFAPAKTLSINLRIAANPQSFALANLYHIYDGSPKPPKIVGSISADAVRLSYKSSPSSKEWVSAAPIEVGSYPVRATHSPAGAAAKPIVVNATMVIAPSPLWIIAKPKARRLMRENPPLDYDILNLSGTKIDQGSVRWRNRGTQPTRPSDDGVINLDTPSLITTATLDSPPGSYPIRFATKGSSANHTIIALENRLIIEGFGSNHEALVYLPENPTQPLGLLQVSTSAPTKDGVAFSAALRSHYNSSIAAVGLAGTIPIIEADGQGGEPMLYAQNLSKEPSPLRIAEIRITRDGRISGQLVINQQSLSFEGARLLDPEEAPVPFAGQHSLLLERGITSDPANLRPSPSLAPAGCGFASALIAPNGMLRLVGQLGDGQTMTAALNVDSNSSPGYRLFLQPYRRSTAHLAGSLSLEPHPRLPNRRFSASTNLIWTKGAGANDSTYPNGFGALTCQALLDPWVAPSNDQSLLDLWLSSQSPSVLHWIYSNPSPNDGSLLSRELSLDSRNIFSTEGASTDTWRCATNLKTGTFTGSQTQTPKISQTFSGILRQPSRLPDQRLGGGIVTLSARNPGARPANKPEIGEARLVHPESEALGPIIVALQLQANGKMNNRLNAGDVILTEVTYDQAVSVVGIPKISFKIGNQIRTATYQNGSPGTRLIFSATVLDADQDDDGISVESNSLFLDAASIVDIRGQDAQLQHRGLSDDRGLLVDTLSPRILGVRINSRNELQLTLSEAIDPDNLPATSNFQLLSAENTSLPFQVETVSLNQAGNQVYLIYKGTDAQAIRTALSTNPKAIRLAYDDPSAADDNQGALQDLAGNDLANQQPMDIKGSATIQTIALTSASGAQNNLLNIRDRVNASVTFTEPVHVTGQPTLVLSLGSGNKPAMYSSGSGSNVLRFTAEISQGDQDDDGISITANALSLNGGSIANVDGFTAHLSHSALGPDPAYKVDTTAPALRSVALTSAIGAIDGVLNPGDSLTAEVNFTEPVRVQGSPSLEIQVGNTITSALYVNQPSEMVLRFSYQVTADDQDIDGISIPANSLRLDAGNLQDAAGNSADLRHAEVAANSNYRVIKQGGGIVDIGITSALGAIGPWLNAGDQLQVSVRFSNTVTVTATPSLALNIGAASRTAVYQSGSGTDTLQFLITIGSTDNDPDGISIDANALSLNGGSITDRVGNPANLSHSAVRASSNHRVDTSRPILTDANFSASNNRIIVSFSEALDWTNPPTAERFSLVNRSGVDLGLPLLSVSKGNNERSLWIELSTASSISLATTTSLLSDVTRLRYEDLSNGDDLSSVAQDLAGNDAANLQSFTLLTRPIITNITATEPWPGGNEIGGPGERPTITITISEPVTLTNDLTLTFVVADNPTNFCSFSLTRSATASATFSASLRLRSGIGSLSLISIEGGELQSSNGSQLDRSVLSNRPIIINNYQVDLVQPAAPVLSLRNDTGLSNSDFVTSDASIIVSNLEPNCSWQFSLDEGASWRVGSGNVIVAGLGLTPANHIRAKQTDEAGNESPEIWIDRPLTVDRTRPTITRAPTAVSPPAPVGSWLKLGNTITVDLEFSEECYIEGEARLPLTIGSLSAEAVGTGRGRTLRFNYPIVMGDEDGDGFSIANNALSLYADNRIQDIAGNTASPIHQSLPDNINYRISTKQPILQGAPVYAGFRGSATKGYLEVGAVIIYRANFSAPVVVGHTPTLLLSFNPSHATPLAANYVSGSGSNSLLFEYTVRGLPEEETTQGCRLQANAINLINGGGVGLDATIRDLNESDIRLEHPAAFTPEVKMDFTPPQFVSVDTSRKSPTNNLITLHFSDPLDPEATLPSTSCFSFLAADGVTVLDTITLEAIEITPEGALNLTTSESLRSNEARVRYTRNAGPQLVNLAGLAAPSFLTPPALLPDLFLGSLHNGFSILDSSIDAETIATAGDKRLGFSTKGVGDINGDGLDDLAITAPIAPTLGLDDGKSIAGQESAWIVFGRTDQTQIDLANLGNAGFKISFSQSEKTKLCLCAPVGDLNEDGLKDVILTAWGIKKAFVVYGKADSSPINLNDLWDPANANTTPRPSLGFVISGAGSSSSSKAYSMAASGLGDINGDGRADYAIGESWHGTPGADSGRVVVILGNPSRLSNCSLQSLVDGVNGFEILSKGAGYNGATGPRAGEYLCSIDAAGDVNGDGFADLALGASLAGLYPDVITRNYGNAYVVYGRQDIATRPPVLYNLEAQGHGYAVQFAQENSAFAQRLAGIGDFNGDGLSDLATTSPLHFNELGMLTVTFGRSNCGTLTYMPPVVTLAAGSSLTAFGVNTNDQFGSTVSAAGDINGDGLADVFVDARYADNNKGRSHVIYGTTLQGLARVDFVENLRTFPIGGNLLGRAPANDQDNGLSAAGDVNGDGFADLIVGACNRDRVYVILGGPNLPANLFIAQSGYRRGNNISAPNSDATLLVGTAGDDQLTISGNPAAPAGNGRILAGAGDDLLRVQAPGVISQLATRQPDGPRPSLQGGGGLDTLALSGTLNFDLSTYPVAGAVTERIPSRVSSIEHIDLTNETPTNLKLGISQILEAGRLQVFNSSIGHSGSVTKVRGERIDNSQGRRQMAITGDDSDLVFLDLDQWSLLAQGNLEAAPEEILWQGRSYRLLNHIGRQAQLLVETDIGLRHFDETPPRLNAVSLVGNTLQVVFNEAIAPSSIQGCLRFSFVNDQGLAVASYSVVSASFDENRPCQLTLFLGLGHGASMASALAANANAVRLRYTAPSLVNGSTNLVEDLSLLDLPSQSALPIDLGPLIVDVTASDNTEPNEVGRSGEVAQVVLTFSEEVTISGNPTLVFQVGPGNGLDATRQATASLDASASGVTSRTLSLTLPHGDGSLRLIGLSGSGSIVSTSSSKVLNPALISSNAFLPARYYRIQNSEPGALGFRFINDTGLSGTDCNTKDGRVELTNLREKSYRYCINALSASPVITEVIGNGVDPPPTTFSLPDGTYPPGMIKMQSCTVLGTFEGPWSSNPQTWIVDNSAPAPPTLNLPMDLGISDNDGITRDNICSATYQEPGGTCEFSLDFGSTWQICAGENSQFRLADGSYRDGRILVRLTDPAGNTSATQANAKALLIDTTPPAAPSMALDPDTGIAGDGISESGTIKFGGLEIAATLYQCYNGNAALPTWTSTFVPTASMALVADQLRSDPSETVVIAAGGVRAYQQDAAGNDSPITLSGRLTILPVNYVSSAPRIPPTFTAPNTVVVPDIPNDRSWQYTLDGRNPSATWYNGSGNRLLLAAGTYEAGTIGLRQIDEFGYPAAGSFYSTKIEVAAVGAARAVTTMQETWTDDRISQLLAPVLNYPIDHRSLTLGGGNSGNLSLASNLVDELSPIRLWTPLSPSSILYSTWAASFMVTGSSPTSIMRLYNNTLGNLEYYRRGAYSNSTRTEDEIRSLVGNFNLLGGTWYYTSSCNFTGTSLSQYSPAYRLKTQIWNDCSTSVVMDELTVHHSGVVLRGGNSLNLPEGSNSLPPTRSVDGWQRSQTCSNSSLSTWIAWINDGGFAKINVIQLRNNPQGSSDGVPDGTLEYYRNAYYQNQAMTQERAHTGLTATILGSTFGSFPALPSPASGPTYDQDQRYQFSDAVLCLDKLNFSNLPPPDYATLRQLNPWASATVTTLQDNLTTHHSRLRLGGGSSVGLSQASNRVAEMSVTGWLRLSSSSDGNISTWLAWFVDGGSTKLNVIQLRNNPVGSNDGVTDRSVEYYRDTFSNPSNLGESSLASLNFNKTFGTLTAPSGWTDDNVNQYNFKDWTLTYGVSDAGLYLSRDTGYDGFDGISRDGRIDLTNLNGLPWQYSLDAGVTWQNGTGTSFTLPENTYAAGRIRARQINPDGRVGLASVNPDPIVVDQTAPRFYTTEPNGAAHVQSIAGSTIHIYSPKVSSTSDSDVLILTLSPTNGSVRNWTDADFALSGQQMINTVSSINGWASGTTVPFDAAPGTHALGVQLVDLAGNAAPSTSYTNPNAPFTW